MKDANPITSTDVKEGMDRLEKTCQIVMGDLRDKLIKQIGQAMTEEDHEDTLKMLEEIDRDGLGLCEWDDRFVSQLMDADQEVFTADQASEIERIWVEQFE